MSLLLGRILGYLETYGETEEGYSSITPSKKQHLEEEFKKQPDPPKISFDPQELECLYDGQWLNDAILNSYISLMASKSEYNVGYTNSFFYKKLERDGCKAASMWQGIKGQPINQYDRFFIPICLGVHWISAEINFFENHIAVLDSFNTPHKNIGRKLNEFLEFQGIDPLPVIFPRVPQQLNGDDCGVFTIQFGRAVFFNFDFNYFSQSDIPLVREQIYDELSAYL